jgi:ribonuclease D
MSLITTNTDLKAFCKTLENAPFITVDTEFLRDRTFYARLCLIQVSGPDRRAVAIDVLSSDEQLDLSPLWRLFDDPCILKVFHAARQDLEILWQMTGRMVHPLFDTQVAAMVCGYGEQISYEALVADIARERMDKSSQFTDWARRPLSPRQLTYALNDVIYLVDVYQYLAKKLEKEGRVDWVKEEMAVLTSPETYEINPNRSWERLKIRSAKPRDLAILRELCAWRELEAQRKDVPRSRILRDETLMDLGFQRPQTPEDLERIRGISSDMAQGRIGRALIDVIAKGLAVPDEECPRLEHKAPLAPRLIPVIEMLKMLLRIQASEYHVAAKLVATSDDIEALAEHPDEYSQLSHGWRYEVFGRVAQDMMAGKLALTLDRGKIKLIST